MWLEISNFNNVADAFNMYLGRALCLCQNFEINCKHALLFFDLGTGYREKKINVSNDEEMKSYVQKLLKRMLQKIINALNKRHGISKMEYALLTQAKDSKNYLIHESAKPFFYAHRRDQSIIEDLSSLRNQVLNIA